MLSHSDSGHPINVPVQNQLPEMSGDHDSVAQADPDEVVMKEAEAVTNTASVTINGNEADVAKEAEVSGNTVSVTINDNVVIKEAESSGNTAGDVPKPVEEVAVPEIKAEVKPIPFDRSVSPISSEVWTNCLLRDAGCFISGGKAAWAWGVLKLSGFRNNVSLT